MFKLLRLAIYAMVGYTVYQFVSDVIHADAEASATSSKGSRRNKPAQRATAPMTGARRGGGVGKAETTQEPDGAGVRHRVGRGVV